MIWNIHALTQVHEEMLAGAATIKTPNADST